MKDYLDDIKAFSIALLLVAFAVAIGCSMYSYDQMMEIIMRIGEGWNG